MLRKKSAAGNPPLLGNVQKKVTSEGEKLIREEFKGVLYKYTPANQSRFSGFSGGSEKGKVPPPAT